MLDRYAEAQPNALWQAGSATALFVGALGSTGYAIRKDLSGGYRLLFFGLLALIVFGLVTVFVSIPGGNVIYALVGLGIFGGYTVLDFNRMRRAGVQEAVPIAAGICFSAGHDPATVHDRFAHASLLIERVAAGVSAQRHDTVYPIWAAPLHARYRCNSPFGK